MKKQIIGYVEIPLEGFDGKPAKKLVLPVYAAKALLGSDAVLARIRKNSSLLMVDATGRGIAFAEYLKDQGIKAKHVRVVNKSLFNAHKTVAELPQK